MRFVFLTAPILFLSLPALAATEFHIAAAAEKNNMEIAPNYLTGIEMDTMMGMEMGKDEVHLEADVHAAKGEPHGFTAGAWMPYLTISYTLEKQGGTFKKTGTLLPMTAGDGPHYANNLTMDGPGDYTLTYHFEPPSKNGFHRHVDKATGVADWWEPFDMSWKFTYPAKAKGE